MQGAPHTIHATMERDMIIKEKSYGFEINGFKRKNLYV